ncbi:MAG TPA: hypothetical protein PKK95_05725 [Vicinamibacterales bacterium]|jgi:hypothetical protein|nr:hypothetical protein [Acidobacteriota bacterium]HOC17744.1 hypothetical protein [Vicinamibacterales bacterium]
MSSVRRPTSLTTSAILPLLAFIAAVALAGCGADSPTAPGGGVVARILVSGETFRVLLTTDEQVAAAKAAQAGGRASIPHGRIVAGTQVNAGYSWHLEDVRFVEVTIEVCDGRPSMVEAAGGPSFADGTFCPWGARVISVE